MNEERTDCNFDCDCHSNNLVLPSSFIIYDEYVIISTNINKTNNHPYLNSLNTKKTTIHGNPSTGLGQAQTCVAVFNVYVKLMAIKY